MPYSIKWCCVILELRMTHALVHLACLAYWRVMGTRSDSIKIKNVCLLTISLPIHSYFWQGITTCQSKQWLRREESQVDNPESIPQQWRYCDYLIQLYSDGQQILYSVYVCDLYYKSETIYLMISTGPSCVKTQNVVSDKRYVKRQFQWISNENDKINSHT